MLIGGVWTLIQIRGPIVQSLQQLLALYRTRNASRAQGASHGLSRTRELSG